MYSNGLGQDIRASFCDCSDERFSCEIRNVLGNSIHKNVLGMLCIMNAQHWNMSYALKPICNIVIQHETTFPSLELVQRNKTMCAFKHICNAHYSQKYAIVFPGLVTANLRPTIQITLNLTSRNTLCPYYSLYPSRSRR